MSDTHHCFAPKACRKFALEQNQRLFRQAWQLDHQAFTLLDHPQFDAEYFAQYQHLRRKAQCRYQEAIEHLTLIHHEFADTLQSSPESTARPCSQAQLSVAASCT
ncbi:hypothetical protein [Pseudomonas sp. UM16]|uniref:hypothetical protein n=1 Tax=Pseudomonas sp. UM16 TaxID=3158962 RepID=UPI00398FB24A